MPGASGGTESFAYDLPPELIAQDPPARRGDSRLLLLERGGRPLAIRPFTDLPDLLREGDVLVINDSLVMRARLRTRRRDTGGQVEVLLVHPESGLAPGAWRALARPARRLHAGQELVVLAPDTGAATDVHLTVLGRGEDGAVAVNAAGHDLPAVAARWGEVPLPPYIRREAEDPQAAERRQRDRERYQTVYARPDGSGAGSVAAPTAGLHFTPAVLAHLAARGVDLARVTLHVGPGTFRPPTAAEVASGRLHPETFTLPAPTTAALAAARDRGGRIVAVGTTSLRVLQTVHDLALATAAPPGTVRAWPAEPRSDERPPVFTGEAVREPAGWRVSGTTRLFLRPPAPVAAADGLITNFHLPGSSLLMLVAAFAGERAWREAYARAVSRRLRFYSYGDAMLVLPPDGWPAGLGEEQP